MTISNVSAATTTAAAYKASLIKPARRRRSAFDLDEIRDAIVAAVEVDRPMTVRQVFYRLVSTGVIDKTENEYKNTVCRLLADMRRDGTLDYADIADNTRWMRKPRTHGSLLAMLNDSARLYRRSLWDDQNAYVEVWLEKEALAGVLVDVTAEWDVPLMVTRGYSSLSFLHSAGETISEAGRPTFLYYFGDYDPSGCDISRNVEEQLRGFAPDAELYFQRVAVNREQISKMGLPTRPTKKTDSRSKNFEGESVEVDAIPPATLREMCRGCIERDINGEEQERRTLQVMAMSFAEDDEDAEDDDMQWEAGE